MKILRWAGYLFAIFLLVCSTYLVNLFFMKPFSLDHYLAKNLVVRFIDTPEGLTYLGVVDKFNWITGHLSELSIKGKDDIFEEIQKAKDQRSIISSYETSDLSEEQREVFLLNRIEVGIPLNPKVLARVFGGSKYDFKFFIFKSLKKNNTFPLLSCPTLIGNI